MPKAKYTSTKGLYQETGTGIDFASDTTGLNARRTASTLSTVGTVAAPTKVLTTAESGGIFFCDFSTVSIVLQLPAPSAGLNYKIVASTASDNEATKDLLVHTGVSTVDMGGNIMLAGAILEITAATSAICIQGGTAAATVGDYLYFECDGTDWYVSGSVTTAAAAVINNAFDGITAA